MPEPTCAEIRRGNDYGAALVQRYPKQFGQMGGGVRLAAGQSLLLVGEGDEPEKPRPIEPLIGEAAHLIVHIARTPGGRRIEEILEVSGFESGHYLTTTFRE